MKLKQATFARSGWPAANHRRESLVAYRTNLQGLLYQTKHEARMPRDPKFAAGDAVAH
jgi:hypothetical protein